MKLFKSSQKASSKGPKAGPQRVVRPKATVHSYYTVSNRSDGIPTIDLSRRTKGGRSGDLRLPTLSFGVLYRFGVVGAVLVAAFFMLTLQSTPIVKVIDRQRQPKVSDRYRGFIEQQLRESVLNRTKPTLQSSSIASKVYAEFPEVSAVSVSYDILGRRPLVSIAVANIPFELDSQGERYLLSDEGRVVGLASDSTARPEILITDESGVSVKRGDVYLRSDDAKFIVDAKSILKAKGRLLTSVVLTDKPREALLVVSDKTYKIKVFFDDSVTDQLGSFFAAEEVVGERGEVPQLYIDVRAGEKVFWL